MISIHTPARGVTGKGTAVITAKKDFNPHSRKGSDTAVMPERFLILNFNPHSRKGSDACDYGRVEELHTFQSTLPQGE